MFLCLCDDNCFWHDTCCMIIYLTMHYHLRDNLKGCITVFFGINYCILGSHIQILFIYVPLTVPSSDIHQYWAWSRSWSDHCWCLKWCKKGSTINKTLRKIECRCCVSCQWIMQLWILTCFLLNLQPCFIVSDDSFCIYDSKKTGMGEWLQVIKLEQHKE